MAYQGDPNRERHRMLQREDGTLKVIPIVLGLAFLLFVGYKLWPHHSTAPRSTATSIDHLQHDARQPEDSADAAAVADRNLSQDWRSVPSVRRRVGWLAWCKSKRPADEGEG
jgi:hypothetical protein